MEKEINDENLNMTQDAANAADAGLPPSDNSEHGLTAEKIAHLLEHLGDEVIRDMLDSAGLDYDDPLGENKGEDDGDEAPEEEYVGKRFKREPEEAAGPDEPEAEEVSREEVAAEAVKAVETAADPEAVEVAGDTTDEKEPETPIDFDAEEIRAETETAQAPAEETSKEETPKPTDKADADDKPADEESGAKTGSESADVSANETGGKEKKAAKKSRRKKPRRKVPLIRRLLFIFVLIGVLALPIAVHFIYISATLNSDDPIQYSEHVDEISCSDGVLKVNNVNASVPTDGTEEYSISYAWSEDDDKYPSVPHAITAVYKGDEGARKYSISLYRNETIPTAEIPEGRNADNWFDEWQASEEDEETVQAPLQYDNIRGFYISPKADPDDPDAPPDYNTYSFYLAVQDAGGVSIYVLEGVCIDGQYNKEFADIMDTCIQSIAINMPGSEQS